MYWNLTYSILQRSNDKVLQGLLLVLIGQRRNIKAFGKPYRKKKMFLIEMIEIYADKFSNLVVRNVYDNNIMCCCNFLWEIGRLEKNALFDEGSEV